MLYHADVFMPDHLKVPVFEGKLRYTNHAQKAASNDRYGLIDLPEHFMVSDTCQLIEAEVSEADRLIKQVWRTHYDQERDLILVVTSEGAVKTVWFNLKSDLHRTLNKGRYVQAPVTSTLNANYKPRFTHKAR